MCTFLGLQSIITCPWGQIEQSIKQGMPVGIHFPSLRMETI